MSALPASFHTLQSCSDNSLRLSQSSPKGPAAERPPVTYLFFQLEVEDGVAFARPFQLLDTFLEGSLLASSSMEERFLEGRYRWSLESHRVQVTSTDDQAPLASLPAGMVIMTMCPSVEHLHGGSGASGMARSAELSLENSYRLVVDNYASLGPPLSTYDALAMVRSVQCLLTSPEAALDHGALLEMMLAEHVASEPNEGLVAVWKEGATSRAWLIAGQGFFLRSCLDQRHGDLVGSGLEFPAQPGLYRLSGGHHWTSAGWEGVAAADAGMTASYTHAEAEDFLAFGLSEQDAITMVTTMLDISAEEFAGLREGTGMPCHRL